MPLAVASGFSHEDFKEMMRPAELLTLGASMLFYPAMYLGAAIDNSHPHHRLPIERKAEA